MHKRCVEDASAARRRSAATPSLAHRCRTAKGNRLHLLVGRDGGQQAPEAARDAQGARAEGHPRERREPHRGVLTPPY